MGSKNNSYRIILTITGVLVLVTGIILFFIPPALFTDPSQGFQVLQSMRHGGGFNNLVAPDQGDISQNYTQYLTWWSPGQYLVPYFFQLLFGVNLAHGIVIAIVLAEWCGLLGLYLFFRKVGFSALVTALSLAFIVCQEAFWISHVYYTGGEILLFSFMGWFLYGCAILQKTGVKLFAFVLLSGFAGFFLKSSFLWMYGAGLCCLWIRLAAGPGGMAGKLKKGGWIGVPAAIAMIVIYIFYISKGESPVSTGKGLKLTAETFSFPLASPILSGFSVDDMVNGLIDHFGKPFFPAGWPLVILIAAAILSLALVFYIIRIVRNNDYRIFLVVFYVAAILFFGISYLKQFNISMESRHFRIIGLLITPGVIYLAGKLRPGYKVAVGLIFLGIAVHSFTYLVKGYIINSKLARGITGIAQPNIDQAALNKVLAFDKLNRGITFVFIWSDIGLELSHNRYIPLEPIPDNLKINANDYEYDGFAGPLYIVLPKSYSGPKEKLVVKSFPNYAGWKVSMLDKDYVLCVADRKK
jgi:hypothetical protein